MTTACSNCMSTQSISIPISPVPDLVGTNHPLPPSQERLVQAALGQMHLDIFHIDSEIVRVQSLLKDLLSKRESLREFDEVHTPLLSPIRRLPSEVLGEIFLQSLPDEWKRDVNLYRCAVMLPGQVCQRWRDVAIATSNMWSSISIWLGPNSEYEVELMRTWLARSAGRTLSLMIIEWRSNLKNNIPFVNMVLAHSHRWKYVDFRLSWSMIRALAGAKHHLPTLQHLSMTMNPPNSDIDALLVGPVDTFDTAPKLTSLSLHSNAPGLLALPWTQLTTIRMRTPAFSLDECYDILQQSPNLVQCDLMPEHSTFRTDPQSFQHNCLRKLSINSATDCGPLFDSLSLPILCDFEYYNSNNHVWPQAQFVSLLRRSACALRRLALAFPLSALAEDDLLECLEITSPSLVELALGREGARNMSSGILARLTHCPIREGTQFLAPRLEILALDLYRGFDDAAFTKMVESRCRMRHHGGTYQAAWLQTVVLEPVTHRGFNTAILKRLRGCRERGLDIYQIKYTEAGDEVLQVPL